MAATQSEILDLINEIQAGADYPADKMNLLLTNILAAAYGPLYTGSEPPTHLTDENDGYRPGSVGYATLSGRYYICQSALAGNAVWLLIPSDSRFQLAAFADSSQIISCSTNTTVVKCTNTNILNNQNCRLKLPPDPYAGKTVIVYFANSFYFVSIADSANISINGANLLLVPEKQQYTITYSGTAWEIVGVSNITPTAISNVDVANAGGTVTTDTNKLTFLGTGATIANNGTGGTNITINPLAGVDVSAGATTIPAAQEITFSSNFAVVADGPGALVTLLPKIGIKQDSIDITDITDNVSSLNFIGPMFETITIQSSGTRADITINGAKVLLLSGDQIPNNTHDRTEGYSQGSLGRNTGSLQRTYICRVNGTNSAVWDLITEDTLTVTYSPIASGTTPNQISYSAANVVLNSSSMTIGEFVLTAPRYAYLGKKVYIFSYVTITTLRFKRADGTQYYGQALPAGTGIVMVCTNIGDGINQIWQRIG